MWVRVWKNRKLQIHDQKTDLANYAHILSLHKQDFSAINRY